MTIEPRPLTAERRAEIERMVRGLADPPDGFDYSIVLAYAALLHAEQRITELERELQEAKQLIESCAAHFTRDHRNDDELNHGSRCGWADEARAYMEAHE